MGILSERGASFPLPPHINQEAFHFELTQTLADSQLKLVLDNIKRATASSLYAYEIQQERLPQVNDFNILTDWAGTPFCVIKTTAVTILPFHKITFALCMREGEDDTLESWQKTHRAFFTKEGNALAIRFVRICRLYSRILRSSTGDREKGCVFLRVLSLLLVNLNREISTRLYLSIEVDFSLFQTD